MVKKILISLLILAALVVVLMMQLSWINKVIAIIALVAGEYAILTMKSTEENTDTNDNA